MKTKQIKKYLKPLITYAACFFLAISIYGQSFKGTVDNYVQSSLYLYQCYGDTLLFADSTITNKNGEFAFDLSSAADRKNPAGIYRVILQGNQFFYVLNDGNPINIRTLYQPSSFYNIATDSLTVLQSEENKRFYEFQRIQQQLNVTNQWLLQMMRLYPLHDPFHKKIENEYYERYKAMEQFVKGLQDQGVAAEKIALAYHQPRNPDWKQPDPWRDSIIASHYFDHFNPADSFYMYTNILSEKMDIYLVLRTNKRDAYGQPVNDEMLFAGAAETFLENTLSVGGSQGEAFEFCLNYFLKKLSKEHQYNAFMSLYDRWVKTEDSSCEPATTKLNWAREKASVLRGVQIGSIGPDFEIMESKLKMHELQSDYTLLVFWASWCPHCTKILPEIKNITDRFNQKQVALKTVAISLDTDKEKWQQYVQDNGLFTWLNTSELKGWKGDVSKRYNVYATPTMFLLDKDKKIIAKPNNVNQLKEKLAKEKANKVIIDNNQ